MSKTRISELSAVTQVGAADLLVVVQGDVTRMATASLGRSISGTRTVTASASLTVADTDFWIEAEHDSIDIDLTIPENTFPRFSSIVVEKVGDADVNILGGGATNIDGATGITEQYHVIVLFHKGNNLWTAIGGTS